MYSFFKKIKKNSYGFNIFTFTKIIQRLELSQFTNYNPVQSLLSKQLLSNFYFNYSSYKTRQLVNIYLLNLLGTYRGWRHSRGLPVRGQRTWSNAWSSYRSNLTLRSYKVTISKKIYGTNFSNDYFTAYLAEEVNNMWRLQWGLEWLEAKKKRVNLQKNVKNNFKVDLVSMAKLQIDSFNKKKTSPKLKKSKRNVFTLGFDPGFTKTIIKASKLK